MFGFGRRIIVSTQEHFTYEEQEVDGVTRRVEVCKRCHVILPYGDSGGQLARHHARHIQRDDEDAERVVEEAQVRGTRRVSCVWEHFTKHDYVEDGVNKSRVVCNTSNQHFSVLRCRWDWPLDQAPEQA
jgi:hypothetical protein